jgi:uncharacterized lipoprotein YmbA
MKIAIWSESMKTKFPWIPVGGVLLILAVLGSGCAHSPTPDYYLLRPAGPPTNQIYQTDSKKILVGLRAVHIAAYLDRPQLAVRRGPLHIERDEYNRWAEPLENMIGLILADRLTARLPDAFVVNFPWSSLLSPDLEVAVTITQLDGRPGGKARLRANWAVYAHGKKSRVLYQAKTTLEEDCPDGGAEALVKTTGALVNEFGNVVADVLKELRRKGE